MAIPIEYSSNSEEGTWPLSLGITDTVGNSVSFNSDALSALGFPAALTVIKPSSEIDGSVGLAGGTVSDKVAGNSASVTFPPGVAGTSTAVSINVLQNPLELPAPEGYFMAATRFVDVSFSPRLPSPLPGHGVSITLPLNSTMPVGTPLSLFHLDPVLGALAPARNYQKNAVTGTVNADGLSASFSNVVTLSTLVAYPNGGHVLGDINGDLQVDCADLAILKAAFGKRKAQSGFNVLADLNADGVVDIKDLAVITRQLPRGLTCK